MATERTPISTPNEGAGRTQQRAARATLTPLLTIEQVAGVLGVSPKTVRRLRIPCIRLGRLLRFRASDVERFLAARSFHA